MIPVTSVSGFLAFVAMNPELIVPVTVPGAGLVFECRDCPGVAVITSPGARLAVCELLLSYHSRRNN